MEDMHQILAAICSGTKGVMATIVHVEGSAYKKEGAAMLFTEEGGRIGMLSAGCLEEDLQARIRENPRKTGAELIEFDMRSSDDFSWGAGSGCNGKISVLIEEIDEQYHCDLMKLQQKIKQGEAVLMVKKIGCKAAHPQYLFISENNEIFGKWDQKILEIVSVWQDDQEQFHKRMIIDKANRYYLHVIRAKPRFIVFGAGADARPLVELAAMSGFSVTVADWRPAFCTKEHFPNADNLLTGFPAELIRQLHLTSDDYVMVMTHQFEKDDEIVARLFDQELLYFGILGTKNRTMRLLGMQSVPETITSPAGLAIGASGAEEIAVSIVAQLIQIRNRQQVRV
ncbi:XdhC family protein [Bacillaceae bacterium Marseille-Q3522]|nr:XdhC family protein [Bacillaceae bacterium Marseille-Q3522]